MTATNRDFIAQLDAAIGCQQCGGALGDSPSDDFCSPRCQTAWSAARTTALTTYREPDDQPEHVANLVELHSSETCVACVEGRGHGSRSPWLHEPTFMGTLRAAARRRRWEEFRRLYLNAVVPAVPVVRFNDGNDTGFGDAVRRDAERVGAAFGALVEHTNEPCQMEPFISGQVRIGPPGEPPAQDSPNWRNLGRVREGFSFGFDAGTRDSGGSLVALHRRDGVDHIEAILSPGAVAMPPEFFDRMSAVADEIGRAFSDAWSQIAPAVEQVAQLLPETPPDDPRERALWLRRNRNTGPPVSARAPRAINPRGAAMSAVAAELRDRKPNLFADPS